MKRILKAFIYSYNGIRAAFNSEIAFRQDVLICLIGFIALFFLNLSSIEKILMIFSLLFILLMELVNTAIEVIIDRISLEKHPLSGKAKDIGSSLVLIAFINAILTWLLILY